MSNIPIVTAAGASMRDYCIFWFCIAFCAAVVCYMLHRDLKAIATGLNQLNDTLQASESEKVVEINKAD